MEPLKRCTKCGQEHPATTEYFFAEKRRGPDALRSECKTCARNQVANWRSRNGDKHREWERQNTAKNREKRRKANRDWRARNLDVQRERERRNKRNDPNHSERVREWRMKNPDKQRQRMREYRQNNGDKLRLIMRRYFARKANLPDNFTQVDWQFALDWWHGCCAYCGRAPGLWHALAMDHFLPLNSPDCIGTIPTNMLPACHGVDGCNNSKHDRDPEDWIMVKFGEHRGREILSRIQEFFSLVRQVS